MSLSIGIVGLPNVGKSTLFKAITKKQVDCANYPFCTVEPNVGMVAVPDKRADKLADLTHSIKKVYATIEFVDIAGLVEGAHQGEGLGNQFLANIRETDAIIYILRCFKNEKIVSSQKKIDPISAKEILDTEMALKDLSALEKRLRGLRREAKGQNKETAKELEAVEKAKELLERNKLLFENIDNDEEKILKMYQFLTLKPRLYLLNGREAEVTEKLKEQFKRNQWPFVVLDVLNEFEIGELSPEERNELDVSDELNLDELIKESYKLLNLITFFTTGPDETRVWTIKEGSKAPQAGGVIHTDFEEQFIRAEVINWQKLVEAGGISSAREKGLARTEGKDYIIQEGDVIEIKHSA